MSPLIIIAIIAITVGLISEMVDMNFID